MKSSLRSAALTTRQAARTAAGAGAGSAIADAFLRHVPWTPADVIAGYWPLGDEADVLPLLSAVGARGATTALPVVAAPAQPLLFRRWSDGHSLEAGPHGTQHPPPTAGVVVPTIVLLPLLAFDADGHRLGYGGGYYDRTLSALRRIGPVIAAGIAYAAQECPRLPAERHDQSLDWIVTESGARRFAG